MALYVHIYDSSEKKKRWVDAGDTAAVREGEMRVVQLQDRRIVVTRIGMELCAVDGQCPHRGASLTTARIADGTIRCPVHGYEFDVRSGKGVGNDLTLETIRVIEAEVVPGEALKND